MIEDGALPERDLGLADPVRAFQQVSTDVDLNRPLTLADGSTATALEIQWELFAAARRYAKEHGLAVLGDEAVGDLVIERWRGSSPAWRATPCPSCASSTGWPSCT